MKIALICSHGGHLTEMIYLMEAFKEQDIFLVTYDNIRTRKLECPKYLFPNFGEKPLTLLWHLPRIIRILWKEKPDLLFSNGAEIALPFFYLAKIFRIKTVFMECYTRIQNRTVTGKYVYPVTDLFLVLWREMLTEYGDKAQYWGDLFLIKPCKRGNEPSTGPVLVMVGMHFQGAEHLIKKMDEYAQETEEEVIMQIGNTHYQPQHATYFRFKDYNQIKKLMRDSKVLICQGAMSALDALMLKTPVIVYPRSPERGEVRDKHQEIFAQKLADKGMVTLMSDSDDIKEILSKIGTTENSITLNPDLIQKLGHYFRQLNGP